MQKEYSSYLLNKSVIDSESDDEENSVENLKTKRLTSHLYSEKDIKAKRGDVLFEEEEFLSDDSLENSVFDYKNKTFQKVKDQTGLDFSCEIYNNNTKVDSIIKNLNRAMSNRCGNSIVESNIVNNFFLNLFYKMRLWKINIFLRKTNNFQDICSKNKVIFIL